MSAFRTGASASIQVMPSRSVCFWDGCCGSALDRAGPTARVRFPPARVSWNDLKLRPKIKIRSMARLQRVSTRSNDLIPHVTENRCGKTGEALGDWYLSTEGHMARARAHSASCATRCFVATLPLPLGLRVVWRYVWLLRPECFLACAQILRLTLPMPSEA